MAIPIRFVWRRQLTGGRAPQPAFFGPLNSQRAAAGEQFFFAPVVLLLGLAPHVHPDLFSDLILNYLPAGGDLAIFGGVRGANRDRKNLEAIFNTAQTRNWILFFDEADGLFGKRGSGGTANERYANQETGYLLQRLEDYPKLIILATNFKHNLDSAFMRRFQSVIRFPVPDVSGHRRLWQKTLPGSIAYPDLNVEELASRFELSGAAILNCVQMTCLHALASANAAPRLSKAFLIDEIRREYQQRRQNVLAGRCEQQAARRHCRLPGKLFGAAPGEQPHHALLPVRCFT